MLPVLELDLIVGFVGVWVEGALVRPDSTTLKNAWVVVAGRSVAGLTVRTDRVFGLPGEFAPRLTSSTVMDWLERLFFTVAVTDRIGTVG